MTQKQYALLTARRPLADLVFNMSRAEGNPISIVEVMTLLDGISVTGHRITDEKHVLRLARSWNQLLQLVANGRFKLPKRVAMVCDECDEEELDDIARRPMFSLIVGIYEVHLKNRSII